jgi:tyrosyl-tRNA synthetase
MFGKLMSISDDLMWRYYELLTDLRVPDIKALHEATERGEKNPRDIKVELAKRIIADFHSAEDARAAEDEFNRRFRQKQAPSEMEERTVAATNWPAPRLLVEIGLAASIAEARRLIDQGGVYVDDLRLTNVQAVIPGKPGGETVVKVGKRRYVRVRFE